MFAPRGGAPGAQRPGKPGGFARAHAKGGHQPFAPRQPFEGRGAPRKGGDKPRARPAGFGR
jgi:hypothetical protein